MLYSIEENPLKIDKDLRKAVADALWSQYPKSLSFDDAKQFVIGTPGAKDAAIHALIVDKGIIFGTDQKEGFYLTAEGRHIYALCEDTLNLEQKDGS